MANRLWGPVASEIQRSGLVSGDRSEWIAYHLCTEVRAAEAVEISSHLNARLQAGGLPPDIDPNIAQKVADFAAASSGFEVC